MAKIIHRWIPTNAHLAQQTRHQSAMCPRCNRCKETANHILQCNEKTVIESRTILLCDNLEKLTNIGTDRNILQVLEEKLTSTLHIKNSNKYITIENSQHGNQPPKYHRVG
jgi:hypothetical protein